MRLTLTIFLLCGLGAAIWAEASGRDAEVVARWPGRIAPPEVQAGVRARLMALPGVMLADIVIGEEGAKGEWSVRARALDPAWPSDPARPVFGSAVPLCDAERQRASCWRLATFEVDGATFDGVDQ